MAECEAKLFQVTSPNKIGLLPRPNVTADVSAYLPSRSFFVVVCEWQDPANQRQYLQLPSRRGWVAACSRKDSYRSVVSEVASAVGVTSAAHARLFTVTSHK